MLSLILATKKDIPKGYCNSTLIGTQYHNAQRLPLIPLVDDSCPALCNLKLGETN